MSSLLGGRLRLRTELRPEDAARVRGLAAATGFFRDPEVAIAAELVEEALARGQEASGYHFVVAEEDGALAGYACHGPIAGSVHSFDLYWIVVAPPLQGRGLGRLLMAAVERETLEAGGRRIYVDTSATPAYAPTRAFYARCGYEVAAELPDFYAPGDGKVILCKVLG